MSRGVKDLRELVCMSRLTFRESDSESEDSSLYDDVIMGASTGSEVGIGGGEAAPDWTPADDPMIEGRASRLGEGGLPPEDVVAVREMLANAHIDPAVMTVLGHEAQLMSAPGCTNGNGRSHSSSSSSSNRSTSSRKSGANKSKTAKRGGGRRAQEASDYSHARAPAPRSAKRGSAPPSPSISNTPSSPNKFVVAPAPPKDSVRDLKMARPLPSIARGHQSSSTVIAGLTRDMTSSADKAADGSDIPSPSDSGAPPPTRRDFADVLVFANQSVISDWLHRAQVMVDSLSAWAEDTSKYVRFCQFWLQGMAAEQRRDILAFERGILLEELSAAFRAGLDADRVTPGDLSALLKALFREYPAKLLASSSGTAHSGGVFLDYLDIFTSHERTPAYRRILADVKLSTSHREHAQTALATRLFSLVSVWSAVVNFHGKLAALDSGEAPPGDVDLAGGDNRPLNGSKDEDANYQRLCEAIRCGYVETTHFFLNSDKVAADVVGPSGRTLVLHTVACNRPQVLAYLLKKWKHKVDVNRPCDTGNTPLHVATNLGSAAMTKALVSFPGLHLDPANESCEGATPLHLAAMHGHCSVVKVLLQAGADPHKPMGDLSLLTIAEDFGHEDVADLLLKCQ